MKVTLINYDKDAAHQLIFTKHTRLEMNASGMDDVRRLSPEAIDAELRYMAQTIPSSWEFTSYTWLVEGVSRAFTHQFVRTRTASFAQQSMRVVRQEGFDFVMPPRIASDKKRPTPRRMIAAHLDALRGMYSALLRCGVAPEDARSILPTNVATNIVARMTLRGFVDLARARLGGRTQDEYRSVVEAMVDCVLEVHPWAEYFLFGNRGRDYFREIEDFAEQQFGGDLETKGKLLKIIDKMRSIQV